MTTKSDYTESQWKSLMEAPGYVGTYIVASDVSLTGVPREMAGLAKAMQSAPAPEGAAELVGALVTDMMAGAGKKKDKAQESAAPKPEPGSDPKAMILGEIQKALDAVDAKGAPEERAGYRSWLMMLAQATAEAGKEGGFLGIGAVRVSDKEKAALDELRGALGLA
jgi:hypothetical protein